MAPSTDTITAFNTFTPSTLIASARVNENFANFRGHLIPIDASLTAAVNISIISATTLAQLKAILIDLVKALRF